MFSPTVPAHFIEKFSMVSVRRGDSARLTCEAYGTRPISVQWLVHDSRTGATNVLPVNPGSSFAGVSFGPPSQHSTHHTHAHRRNDQMDTIGPSLMSSDRLNAFQKDYISSTSGSDDDRTVFELLLTRTILNDTATYVCKVSNEFGDDVHNIELTVLGTFFDLFFVVFRTIWNLRNPNDLLR